MHLCPWQGTRALGPRGTSCNLSQCFLGLKSPICTMELMPPSALQTIRKLNRLAEHWALSQCPARALILPTAPLLCKACLPQPSTSTRPQAPLQPPAFLPCLRPSFRLAFFHLRPLLSPSHAASPLVQLSCGMEPTPTTPSEQPAQPPPLLLPTSCLPPCQPMAGPQSQAPGERQVCPCATHSKALAGGAQLSSRHQLHLSEDGPAQSQAWEQQDRGWASGGSEGHQPPWAYRGCWE